MSKIVAATQHECYGTGGFEVDKSVLGLEDGDPTVDVTGKISTENVSGKTLGLPPEDIAVQHFDDGHTRPLCVQLTKDGLCTKLHDATGAACLKVLSETVSPQIDGDTTIDFLDEKCIWQYGADED